ncbi:Exocyst complex component S5 [Umbelopsis nana]
MADNLGTPEFAEEAAILRFYNIDTLEPETWVDEVYGSRPNSHLGSANKHFSRTPESSPNPQQDFVDENDLQVQDDSDPLGLKQSIFSGNRQSISRNINLMEIKERSSLITSNKSFNPRSFLLQIHKDTSYEDLVVGLQRLNVTIDQRSDALKSLVHSNFDRFVSAKNTIDHIHDEMKSKNLNEQEEYGTKKLHRHLIDANTQAEKIYGPVIERRGRAEKVRTTLNILERYKFFFNLPSGLLESIKQGKYETAIRDYKKGKYLYQNLKGETVSTGEPADAIDITVTDIDKDSGITELHRKVFDKVWMEVDKIVIELRGVLFKMLEDPWLPIEEQEKTINFLFDLDTTEDPAWFYLSSQYKWITSQLTNTFKEGVRKIELWKSSIYTEESDVVRSLSLKNATSHIHLKDADFGAESDPELKAWRATLDLVKTTSNLLLRCLPDFWKLSTSFIEGKFAGKDAQKASASSRRKRQGVDLGKVEQCQVMAKDIVNLFAQLLSNYFELEVVGGKTSTAAEPQPGTLPKFLPKNTNSVHVSDYLTRIIGELANCVNDINLINLAGEAFSGLTELMEQTRWKFIEVICKCWARDAKTFYLLEDWALDNELSEYTNLLRHFYEYHKYCSRSAYKIASLSAVTDNQRHEITVEYLKIIRDTFLESLYSFLDGLVHLAFSDYTPLQGEEEELNLTRKRGNIDVHSMDVRILLTVSNLSRLKSHIIRKLLGLFEAAYKCSMEDELKTLIDVVDQLDGILFEDYIKRKSTVINEIITSGILKGGIDWYNISKPTEVHPFVYEALMSMVMVHSQVTSVSKSLVYRALSALLENMASDCLESFRQVERFGMGGMLQATLEIEFMHQTLSQYVTPQASDLLQQIYQTIEQAYDPQQQHSGNLQNELSSVKKLLVDSRKSTVVQYLCFKQVKERKKES